MNQLPVKFVRFRDSVGLAGDTLLFCKSARERTEAQSHRIKAFQLSWDQIANVIYVITQDSKHSTVVPLANVVQLILEPNAITSSDETASKRVSK